MHTKGANTKSQTRTIAGHSTAVRSPFQVVVRPLPAPATRGEFAAELPDSAILHGPIQQQVGHYGQVESVWCARCGADVESYQREEAIEAGADRCDLARDDLN